MKQNVLRYILDHLSQVLEKSSVNKMIPANMNLTFAPLLFAIADSTPEASGITGWFASKPNAQGATPEQQMMDQLKSDSILLDLIRLKDEVFGPKEESVNDRASTVPLIDLLDNDLQEIKEAPSPLPVELLKAPPALPARSRSGSAAATPLAATAQAPPTDTGSRLMTDLNSRLKYELESFENKESW